jgi:hypothetical protein
VEPLLNAGIEVDVCIILERPDWLFDIYQKMAQRVDLKSVDLLASSTVAPDLRGLFRSTFYFFRPGLNIYPGFGADKSNMLPGCDPTVTNTGLALAVFLNFNQCVLLGVDMGSVKKDQHHIEGTVYDKGGVVYDQEFKMPARSTAGGVAHTSSVLHWARQSLENLIRGQAQRKVINCSDGVLIEHAIPFPINLVGSLNDYFPVDDCELPCLEEFTQSYDTGRLTYDRAVFEELIADVREALEGFSWERRNALGQTLFELLWKSGNQLAIPMMIRGSLYLLVWHALSVLGRLDADDRARADGVFRDGLLACVDYMAYKVEATVFDSLDALGASGGED